MAETFTLLNGRPVNGRAKTDGSEVRISFETDQGEIEIASTPEGLWNLAGKMSELAVQAIAAKSRANGETQKIHVAAIVEAKAETPIDAPIVALGLKGTNGSVQHFGLSPDTSAALRREMEAAEPQARDNQKKNLQ